MFLGSALTMMLGSIPQQDVFQRVMSAKDAKTARRGAMIGGFSYIAFAFVPMFIVLAAVVVMGDKALDLAQNDYQRVLPTFIMGHMPLVMQILFFGALLSAIKSTSSATLLAPTTSFVENILKQVRPGMSDKQQLLAMRITLVVFALSVLVYSIKTQGTPIYDMVSGAYQVTLVGAFVPLVFGLYWKRSTTQGAALSVVAGIATWVLFLLPQFKGWSEVFPGQLAGLIVAIVGMVAGSLLPQWLVNRHEHVSHHLQPHGPGVRAPPLKWRAFRLPRLRREPHSPCPSTPTAAAPVATPRTCCKSCPTRR
jgi:SSS family solute:Na+ symporter